MENCDENICLNGGTCQLIAGDYLCQCPKEFYGIDCGKLGIFCYKITFYSGFSNITTIFPPKETPPFIGIISILIIFTLFFWIVICVGITLYRIRHRMRVKPLTTAEVNRQSIYQTRTTSV